MPYLNPAASIYYMLWLPTLKPEGPLFLIACSCKQTLHAETKKKDNPCKPMAEPQKFIVDAREKCSSGTEGNQEYCYLLAFYSKEDREQLCEKGNDVGCALICESKVEDSERFKCLSEQCSKAGPYSCYRAALFFSKEPSIVIKKREYAEKACESSISFCVPLCTPLLGEMEPKHFPVCKELCDKGNVIACQGVGVQISTTGSKTEALEIFKEICLTGVPKSCFNAAMTIINESKCPEESKDFLKIACDANLPEACGMLGLCKIWDKDEVGLKYVKNACDAGIPYWCFALGKELQKSDPKQSIEVMKKTCSLIRPAERVSYPHVGEACATVANAVYVGISTIVSLKKAKTLALLGCEYGNITSCVTSLVDDTLSSDKNVKQAGCQKAIDIWLTSGGTQPNPHLVGVLSNNCPGYVDMHKKTWEYMKEEEWQEAQSIVKPLCLKDGSFCATAIYIASELKDGQDYMDFTDKACNSGNAYACSLGLLADRSFFSTGKRQEIAKDGCSSGLILSCIIAGLEAEENGNLEVAVEEFSKGCNEDLALSCFAAGRVYEKMGQRDKVQEYFAQACGLGSIESCYFLALLEPEEEESKATFEQACNLGVDSACHTRAAVSKDRSTQIEWLSKGCIQGDVFSCHTVGDLLASEDCEHAKTFWEQACEYGDGMACAKYRNN